MSSRSALLGALLVALVAFMVVAMSEGQHDQLLAVVIVGAFWVVVWQLFLSRGS